MCFSERIIDVKSSETLAITSRAKAMRSSGEDVVILAAGEPDFDTPERVKEAAYEAIRSGQTKYTPSGGTKVLKQAICSKLKRDNALDYNIDEIVVSNGAKHSLYNILQVICNPGDEILIISPYWLSYPEMTKLAGAQPRIIKTSIDNGFKVRPEDIERACTEKTKAVIINSPSNPAGVVYEKEELEKIAEVCVNKGIIIISDEIYEMIIFDDKKHFSIANVSHEARALTIVVNGLSKSHSMTGWRIGYMAAEEKIAKLVDTLQSHSTSNPCSISQAAACRALSPDLDEEIERNRIGFKNRRDFLMDCLAGEDKIKPFKPTGSFYLFCDVSACALDSFSFAQKLLEEKKVAVIPGGPFGEDGFIRISFAADKKTIKEGIDRIKEWIR
ncbi:MAG: pyridoxal phosphate-dependent aminotransferase [Candidatus Omnitrophota bacterium]